MNLVIAKPCASEIGKNALTLSLFESGTLQIVQRIAADQLREFYWPVHPRHISDERFGAST